MSKGRRNGTGHSFNPRPPCGERPAGLRCQSKARRFNPRPPCGERRTARRPTALSCCFNPRPPCGERPCPPWMTSCSLTVSIHALLAESDQSHLSYRGGCVRFNPRPPCGERRAPRHPRFPAGRFQSTPSLRRATESGNPQKLKHRVSIHALLAESDS